MKIKRIAYAGMVFMLLLCFCIDGIFFGETPVSGPIGGEEHTTSQEESDISESETDEINTSETELETEYIEPEDLEPVEDETKVVINDMSKAFALLLEKGTKNFFQGYPIDDAFLHWVNNTFGEEVILDLAYRLYEGYDNPELWYYHTENTMHVLWLKYCQELQFATYYLENVSWITCSSDTVTIDFTGDINLADDWYTMEMEATKANGIYDCISPEITEELKNADLSVINNEFVISDRGEALRGKAYTFRAKTANVALLEVFGADVANLANNHVYDFGADALLDTKQTLENAGIVTMGAGADINEARQIQYFVANGKKIAIVAATEIEKYSNYTKEATEDTPGVLKTQDKTKYIEVIERAKANSDYVIANIHWGVEGRYNYSNSQYRLAEDFVEAGADVVIGGHPHRLQGVEYIEDVPILFSLGNFWFSTGTLYTMIAQIQIDAEGDLAVRAIPCLQKDLTTSMLDEAEEDAFYKFMADISTNVVIDKDGYFYNTADGKNADRKNEENYQSEMNYSSYNGGVDLDGRAIDIVGNLR